MWVEEITLDNIKCFDKQYIRLGTTKECFPWITLLGENGTGKSTVLQALALLIAGPEGAKQLLTRPEGWLKTESIPGKISIKIHQSENDPAQFGARKERKQFSYTFYVTGNQKLTINNKVFTEPVIAEDTNNRILPWLRENALLPKGKGWFGAGYGAFRRLTRENRILVPALQTPLRYTNFFTQFREDRALEAFETWMVYLDYRISKSKDDKIAIRQKEWGIKAINSLLPEGNEFDSIDENGKIWFKVQGSKVSTVALSDGFRSILALAGDLIWRLIEAFPESDNPLHEVGIVLIDELDIHLHPTWQRTIAGWLRATFPKIQFIMATHSPLIVAGAGEDAITYRFFRKNNNIEVELIKNIHAWSVDKILQSEAFGLVSTFSPETQKNIDKYYSLKKKKKLNDVEKIELQATIPFVKEAYAELPSENSLDLKIEKFLSEKLK
ncbi:AAA family ATPase [Mucilaginibacter glaciei]|uniref:ATP-binding protein n=1 Tax=Mucilaginibacter glaciei TaxID=2772109 RepID=A0A926NY66_9SPHI|nr:ATP-binding protein [Mucilaginibacter glaciei]MBD1393829.1 ATP-binding protein [Mucilaginibacter glaciei]